ncbi:ABC transporter permease [Thermodesulfobacteriota bacterium]
MRKKAINSSPEGHGDYGEWTKVIKAKRPWFNINIGEIWNYRDLVLLFVRRDFIAMYKQTILGPLWFFIQPLLTTIIFTIIFGRVAKLSTDGIPQFIFYLSGTVCWAYFAECLTKTSNTFVENANIFGKVNFPRLVLPISICLSNIIKFMIQFSIFLAFMIYFDLRGAPIDTGYAVFTLPLLVLQMGILGIACGTIISSLTTKYHDMTVLVSFGAQLWMYATPVVYPLSQVPEQYRGLYSLNPMVAVVESFRMAFLGTSAINASHIISGVTVTLILFVAGLVLFSRVEKTFLDTV